MPSKHKAGCTCCLGECVRKTFPLTSDWVTGIGGTVASGPTGYDVTLDGIVNPSSYITSVDSYQIQFSIDGAVTFSIDSVDFTVDTAAQTITADTVTVSIGQSARSGARTRSEVFIRATPTHTYVIAFGNYEFASGGYAYGIATYARSATPASSFTADWSNADVFDFRIDDASVTVSQDEVITDGVLTTEREYSERCWSPPTTTCPYVFIKAISRNHEYQDEAVGDQNMPDIVFSGYDPSSLFAPGYTSPTWATPMVLACNVMDDTTSNYQKYGIGDPGCGTGGIVKRWQEVTTGYTTSNVCRTFEITATTFNPNTLLMNTAGLLSIDWGSETIADGYPVPSFDVVFSVLFRAYERIGPAFAVLCSGYYTSGGSVESSVAANSLASGFTATVTGTEQDDRTGSDCSGKTTFGIVGGTWTV